MDFENIDFILVKKTQLQNYFQVPLYVFNKEFGFILFKPEKESFDIDKFREEDQPDLYIRNSDEEDAIKELQKTLNKKLINKIYSGEINEIKEAICEIINETFCNNTEQSIRSLPETIDIIYDGYSKVSDLLIKFTDYEYAGYPLVNHSANVMTIAMLYCLKNQFKEKDTKRISLLALLHDLGITQLSKDVVASINRLNDEQFEVYKTHPAIGHDIIKLNENIDASIAVGVLEHHERIDGSGYPRGISNLSFEGKLIGFIDSFDNLTNSEKTHRKRKRPFDAMLLIKDEVLAKGRFDKAIYKDMCLCLGKN